MALVKADINNTDYITEITHVPQLILYLKGISSQISQEINIYRKLNTKEVQLKGIMFQ